VSEYVYDGISVLQPEPGQVAFYPIIDAIEEFRVNTNSYSAEYGRSNGGVILVNQKSGTNEYHGSLFEFFRNEKLNARNLFATTGPKPLFRRNQYGFVLGGPIRKQKTFFFADYQGSQQVGVVRTSPSPPANNGRAFSLHPSTTPRRRSKQAGAFDAMLSPTTRFQPADSTQPRSRRWLDFHYPMSSAASARPPPTTIAGPVPSNCISISLTFASTIRSAPDNACSAGIPTCGMTPAR
jgi:hypothetical protein